MQLLDMLIEQAFNERMAQAEAHGALVRMASDAASIGDYDTAFLAWLTTGSHEWPSADDRTEWTAEDYAALDWP